MAYEYLTLLDIAKSNGRDKEVNLIEESLNSAPEVALLPAKTISGTSYKTLIRKSFPQPAFRAANEGTEPKKSVYENKLVECFYLDGQLEMDVAVAQADEDGEQHALDMEASGMMKGALLTLGTQLYYGTGTGGDAKGFPGAVQVVDSSLVTDAGGTTADTGSSVYGLKLGDQFCRFIFGLGNVLQLGEWRKQFITRSSKELEAWKNALSGWMGVQFVNKYAVGRIKKLTEDSGKGLTDSLISQWLEKYPVGMSPDVLLMTKRSRGQLQRSRTVTLNGGPGNLRPGSGLELVAPLPTEAFGIPIVVTDSILNTEALTL